MVEGPLVPGSMELPGLHIHLLTGSLARRPGREGLLSSCPRAQQRSSPQKTEGENVGPLQFSDGSYDSVELEHHKSKLRRNS